MRKMPSSDNEVFEQAEDAADSDDCASAHMVLFDAADGDAHKTRLVEAALRVGKQCPIERRPLDGFGWTPERHRELAHGHEKDGVKEFIKHVEADLEQENCERAFYNTVGMNRAMAAYTNDARAGGDIPSPQLEERVHLVTAKVKQKCIIKRKG